MNNVLYYLDGCIILKKDYDNIKKEYLKNKIKFITSYSKISNLFSCQTIITVKNDK